MGKNSMMSREEFETFSKDVIVYECSDEDKKQLFDTLYQISQTRSGTELFRTLDRSKKIKLSVTDLLKLGGMKSCGCCVVINERVVCDNNLDDTLYHELEHVKQFQNVTDLGSSQKTDATIEEKYVLGVLCELDTKVSSSIYHLEHAEREAKRIGKTTERVLLEQEKYKTERKYVKEALFLLKEKERLRLENPTFSEEQIRSRSIGALTERILDDIHGREPRKNPLLSDKFQSELTEANREWRITYERQVTRNVKSSFYQSDFQSEGISSDLAYYKKKLGLTMSDKEMMGEISTFMYKGNSKGVFSNSNSVCIKNFGDVIQTGNKRHIRFYRNADVERAEFMTSSQIEKEEIIEDGYKTSVNYYYEGETGGTEWLAGKDVVDKQGRTDITYYPDGKISSETIEKDGETHSREYYPDGKISSETIEKDGKTHSREYYPDGSLKWSWEETEDRIIQREYAETGKLSSVMDWTRKIDSLKGEVTITDTLSGECLAYKNLKTGEYELRTGEYVEKGVESLGQNTSFFNVYKGNQNVSGGKRPGGPFYEFYSDGIIIQKEDYVDVDGTSGNSDIYSFDKSGKITGRVLPSGDFLPFDKMSEKERASADSFKETVTEEFEYWPKERRPSFLSQLKRPVVRAPKIPQKKGEKVSDNVPVKAPKIPKRTEDRDIDMAQNLYDSLRER